MIDKMFEDLADRFPVTSAVVALVSLLIVGAMFVYAVI